MAVFAAGTALTVTAVTKLAFILGNDGPYVMLAHSDVVCKAIRR
jgi:hypothetical protein